MIDGCGRQIDHLRLSLTNRCNLGCRYCAPEDGRIASQSLDPDFALALVRWLVERHGIRHVRLTGGEPLLYPGLLPLIRGLTQIEALHELTLTTNGQALAAQAQSLRDAGLARINISLDTLDPERFSYLTRGGKIAHTLRGVEEAVACGLTPVKINVVVQRGLNDGEIADIAQWGLSRGCVVRFLEVMPIGHLFHVARTHLVRAEEILAALERRFTLRALPSRPGQPATDYMATGDGVEGVIGVIAPTTRPFCPECRRLRVTAQGGVVTCLHDANPVDLRACWDGRRLDTVRADELLLAAVQNKALWGAPKQSISMQCVGG